MILEPYKEEKVIEDIGVTYVILDSGKYLIDGDIIEISNNYYSKKDNKVAVKDIDNIRLVENKTIQSHYENAKGDILSIEDYDIYLKENLKNAIYDEYDGYYFPSDFLDDEYQYKKFKRDWNLINKPIQQISDPILVEVVKTKYDTGNPYITNLLQHDKKEDNKILCKYDRPAARNNIVLEYMKSIGVEFAGDKNNYNLRTEWCNSTHSNLRYAKAFGSYLFGDEYKNDYKPIKTLEDCIKMYNLDKDNLEKIIHNKFMRAFGNIDEGKFDFAELLNKLETCKNSLISVNPKVKTMNEYNHSLKIIRNIIENIKSKMEAK